MRVVVPIEGGKLTLSTRKVKGATRIYVKATADDGDGVREIAMASAGALMLRKVMADMGRGDMVLLGIRYVDDHK